MDEKYIQDLYNQLGGQSKFGNFNDFKNLIKTDKAYQKDFYNSFGAKKLGDFNDFSGLVSAPNQKKKGSSQPTSQEKQQVSSAQQKERLISAVTGQQPDQQASAGLDGEPNNKIPFEEWYKTVPKTKNDISTYNLKRAYELAPKKDLDAFVKDPKAHLLTSYPNKDGVYEFMKSKNHPTVQKEIDWYNSKEGADFRSKYNLDTSGDYYRYVPKNKQASAGLDGKSKMGIFTGFTPEQLKSMKAKPAPDYMVKKPREKEIQKQTEVSKGELLIQSPPLGQETKSYYRVVADEKRAVENKIKNFEDKYLKAGIDIEQIKRDGTYQDLQKQKAQLDKEYKPVENALREVKKETTTFTRPIERLVSSFTDGKYTLANTEVINLSKDVEDKLIDSFDKLPQEQKQKLAKGSLPTEAKEQLINSAKTDVLNERYASLKSEVSDYIKNVKDNPNISTEQKKLIQDQLKAKNDAFNAQLAIDFSGNMLKNNFKSTEESKKLDEGILSKYEGFLPETLDAVSTFVEGMGSVFAKGATGIPTLALLGAERFNQITGASNPDDYTPIEATLDLINDATNYNFLPSSKSAEGNIVDDKGNLNLSYRSITRSLANTLPFTLKIINDVKNGRIEGSPQSMMSQLLNPKNNKQFRDELIAAETAYKMTIGDNYKQAKDLGMTDANAFVYANVMSTAEGVSEKIMPDIKFFDSPVGSSIKEAFKGNLKKAATKEAAKTVTKDFFQNIAGELGEEEFTLAVEDGLKYSLLLNHKNSEFFNLAKQKELAASTVIMSGALGGVAIPSKLSESKKDIYRGVYNNIADIQDIFAREIKSPLTDKKTKETLYEAYKFASDVANAVAKAPETVTADQIDLLVQKNKLEEKKKNIDTAFHPDINKEIADIDAKITEASKAKVEPVVEEIKTTQPVVTAETSSNFANMTQDGEGNFVFYHVSPTTLDVIDPSKYGSNAGNVTSRDEKAAIGRVGGVAMFYTDPNDSESMVNGNKHVVKVPESEVYDFNSDPNNFYDEAERQFKEANPNMAFSPNDQFAWITKVAGDNGYKMVVGEWGNGKTRAQTTQKLTPVDVMEVSGNTVTKPFEKEYVGNREKGFKSVIPKSKQSKISEAKEAIRSFRSQAGNYDELYQAVNFSRPNMTDEEIKKLVDESDIPQELKDQYNEAMAYEPGKRRTEAPVAAYERTDDVSLDNAPEGTYLNIGLNIGTTQDLMDKDDVISMLPEGVEVLDQGVHEAISEIDGKENKELTLSVKLSRPLTDVEMAKFLVDTKQKAIPQMSESKGAMHGTKEWGDFNPEYFYMPDGSKLSDTASLTKDVDTELEALNKLFDESEQGGKVTDKQIENGKKAIENLVPDVEWVIHDTNESMTAATGSPDRGAYIMTRDKDGNVKKVIHINKASADGTTVAHEVFHAVLLEKVLNDADAQDLTRRMMKAVAKTASPELKRQLDEFARNYEENIRDEEKLAQLIGILAKNYDQLSQPNKTIIKKWLDKLAKMFGLKPFTDNEVIDLLNTIAGKTAKGEAITEEDVMILGDGKINVNKNVERQSKFIDSLVFNRFPTNKNTKVLENFDISSIDGQVAASTLSDKLTAGELKKYKTVGGKQVLESVYTFFGGIGYPEVTGRVWAASKLSGVKKIIDDMKVSSDGYRYLIPAVMSNVSHMSNKNMTSITMEVFKEAINNNELNRTKFKEIVSKAFDNKKTREFKEGALEAISGNISGNKMADNLRDYILSSKMTFDSRKDLLQSMVGNPESGNPKFSTVGTFLSLAKSLSDPIAKDADLHQVPVIIRTKGNLTPVKTDNNDEFYHESYGYHIESDQEIEVLHLDGIYNLTDIIPEFTNENGNTVSTEKELKEKGAMGWDIKRILTNLGRTHGISKYSAKIVSKKPQDVAVTKRSQKSDEGIKFESRRNSEYVVKDNGDVVGRLKLTNNRDLGKGYLEVDTAELLADYIGKGIGSDLYRAAANNLKNEDIVITSSKFRTEKSQSMWEKLEKAGEAIKIYSDNKLKRSVYALVSPKQVEVEVRRYQKDGVTDSDNLNESLLKKTVKNLSDDERKNIIKNIKENEYSPNNTVKAYKLFRVNEKDKGQLFPLFVNADKPVPFGTWIKAAIGEQVEKTKTGNKQVKSKLGPLAFRPGWHSGDIPIATHIGDKANREDKAPSIRPSNQVWAEIEVANDFDWQKEATDRAEKTKDGRINLRTAHITDRLPDAGFYKYKTNSNMTGSWLISGEMKVNKILSDEEVLSINKKNNASDLIRINPFEDVKYGFNKEGLPVDKKTNEENIIAEYYRNSVRNNNTNDVVKLINSKSGNIETKRSQQSIGDYVRIARANKFSDVAIRKFLKSKGFSDTDIDTAMSTRTTGTGRPSVNDIYDESKKAIEDRKKKASIKDLLPYLRKSLLDRQAYIKRLINKIDNKSAKKAYDLLVTKAGASALASERFKRAEKKIYGGLNSDEITILDKIIYANRLISINENRAKLGMEPYTGKRGYSMDDARKDLDDFKALLGADKYNDLSNRATAYFDVFKTNLKKLYDSGRINKETYDELINTEYSPIKTIKYIIGDNLTVDEIDTQAKTLGIARKDIMKLSDSNENDIIMDSKWLLAMTVSSVEGRAFENNMLREFDRAIKGATPEEKKAFEEFILDNPVVGTKKDGGFKYKYDDTELPPGFVKVSYFDNGNKREIVIKDEYAKQLLDVKNKNKELETIGALTGTKILRFFATGGNPLFIIGNTAVDFQNIAFFSDVYSKFKPLATVQLIRDYTKNFIKKIVVSNQYNKVFNEYINHGGALDYMASDGLRALESMNPIKGVTKAAQRGLIAYGRAMAFLGETSEVAFRLSVYDKVKNDSIKEFKKENNREPNEQELDDIMWKAARESRETMDFSQGGDVAKNIDSVFPYFNAALQGIRRPIDFAKKDPVGFSSSVLQYTVMASSLAAGAFAMLIKAVRDDEDDDKKANKKIIEALNSLSEYEKANYHIIFTGNKNNDGEYEYYRVKKLPVLSVISTVAEQLIYKAFFNTEGVDYDMDSEAMMEAVSKSNPLPITVQEVSAKNPVASGLVSYWANKDTFTGDKIFREPNNKKISPEAEGMFDDKVDQIYKDLAPGFGLSPARTKVMVEKVITSANTNPTIPLIYSAYDGLFNNNDGLGAEVQDAMSNVGEAFGKKLVRYTDKNIIRYKEQDKMELQETVIETDVWKKEQKVYNEIKSRYKDGDNMTNKELFDIVEKNFDPIDRIKYIKKYNAYIHNMNIDKSVLDIIFEDVPEVQAMKLNQRYGSDLGDDELKELTKASASAGKRVNNKALYIYNQKYKNRKD